MVISGCLFISLPGRWEKGGVGVLRAKEKTRTWRSVLDSLQVAKRRRAENCMQVSPAGAWDETALIFRALLCTLGAVDRRAMMGKKHRGWGPVGRVDPRHPTGSYKRR